MVIQERLPLCFSPIVFVVSLSMMLMGCVIGPAPFLPDNWKRQAPDSERVSEPQHTPQLQVLIMYSGLSSSHSALRLVENHEHVVVWDPAGDYARFEGGVLEGGPMLSHPDECVIS